MKRILLLTNYKGVFSSKYAAVPYRSGMDPARLADAFERHGFRAEFETYRRIDFRTTDFAGLPVLYTSSEDVGGHYKDYVEDVLWGLEKAGARLVPRLECFRAHHNKVFMEILRDRLAMDGTRTLRSYHFGTLEDLEAEIGRMPFPCVIKRSAGFGSRGVRLGRSPEELLRHAARLSRTPDWGGELWDIARRLRRRGYVGDSRHRSKFIVQTFIPGLSHDWKILVFGDRFYTLCRRNRSGDFRASGSGLLEYRQDHPDGMLDFAAAVFNACDVPNVSLDVAYDGTRFHLLEFQFVLFGTHTIDTSPFHYVRAAAGWKRIEEPSQVETEYARSVASYLVRPSGERSPQKETST